VQTMTFLLHCVPKIVLMVVVDRARRVPPVCLVSVSRRSGREMRSMIPRGRAEAGIQGTSTSVEELAWLATVVSAVGVIVSLSLGRSPYATDSDCASEE
jgi:hypothetical protein